MSKSNPSETKGGFFTTACPPACAIQLRHSLMRGKVSIDMSAPYKNAIFYVLSGTGNTYRLGSWFKTDFDGQGIRTKLIMIEDADLAKDFIPAPNVLVGVLFPAHGFMPPWSMIKFLFRLPRRPGVPAICAATRGAYRLGPIQIPGASGFATFLAAALMAIKGFRVKAIFSLDMPANLINFHWGPHPKNARRISDDTQKKLDSLISRLARGRRIWFTRNNLWEALWTVGIFWMIPLFPILYLIVARMFMAKVTFSNNTCIGCGMCARICANNAIVMKTSGKDKTRPYWTYHCENCMRCMGHCPRDAVEAGHSWGALLYFITSVPALMMAVNGLLEFSGHPPLRTSPWALDMISIIYFLPVLFLAYWLFWHAMRIRIINNLFTYTTLTHVYRRYRHPDAKLKDMLEKHHQRKEPNT